MTIRDRIKEFRRVPASRLVPHERNWREHPPAQVEALEGMLAEIGYADALLVRELSDGRWQIIDGHLRAASTPEQNVPVLVLDLTAEEAEKLLLTHDPLAAMATANEPMLAQLIDSIDFETPAVQSLLASLQAQLATDATAENRPTTEPEIELEPCFQVAVECRHEAEQAELFERLSGEGYRCRLLTM